MTARTALILFTLVGAATAQEVFLVPPPAAEIGAAERATAITAAADALKARDFPAARRHFEWLAYFDPYDVTVLSGLVRASADDPESALFFAHLAAAAAADERGNWPPTTIPPEIAALDPTLKTLSPARVAAAKEVLAFLKANRSRVATEGGQGLLAEFGRNLLREIVLPMPALLRGSATAMNEATLPPVPDTKKVVAGLEDMITNAIGGGRHDLAIAAAQALHGLARQSAFKDLKGPKAPDLKAKADLAAAAIERARREIDKKSGGPATIEQLLAMSDAEREKFTRDHATWASPGVAMSSPKGLYRIETTCGHATLVGAAETIEFHHARLAKFFGTDPFVGRTGVIRIVPEASGLESEGVPYWWAGGFQKGDVTTVRFSVGSIEGLGHTLTHELTHRFDGTLLPFQSSWLVEGKAVWTGHAYGTAMDEEFVPNHASFGTVEAAYIKGYADKKKLEDLIKGTIDDYRDNYTAGYALYLFLKTWESGGKKLFDTKFTTYTTDAMKGRGKPLEWFVANFVDNKDGRPENFDDLVKMWREFLKGFHWLSRAAWLDRYSREVPKGASRELVLDTPTWIYSRSRSEPYFGQDHAVVAAALLAADKRTAPALEAFQWALETDEWGGRVVRPFERFLEESKKPTTLKLIRALDRAKRPWADDTKKADTSFLPELPAVAALIETLSSAAAANRAADRIALASKFEDDVRRLRVAVGAEPDAPRSAPKKDIVAPARRLFSAGMTEDDLHGYEEHRVAGKWFETIDGDVFVGRQKPKTGSGEFDRNAQRRDTYVRTKEWFGPGKKKIAMKIAFTTSYASGDVVFGNVRRDRNLRFGFSAGDYMYAIGQSEAEPKFDRVNWSLSGLRDRDGALAPSVSGGTAKFKEPKTSFDLEILIDGVDAQVFIDGMWKAAYHSSDGLPIEGHVGVAMSMGAVRIARASIQDLSGSRTPDEESAFDLLATKCAPLPRLLNRTVKNVPLGRSGTIVVFCPEVKTFEDPPKLDATETVRTALFALEGVAAARDEARLPQRLFLALPRTVGQEAIASAKEKLAAAGQKDVEILVHQSPPVTPDGNADAAASAFPTILFVDPVGALRVVEAPFSRTLPELTERWCRVLRDADRFAP